MDDVRAVVEALESVADTAVVWPEGLMHPGGPHRRLRGMISPISIGEDECRVFGRLVEAFRPRQAFVIGNAFGLSSAYMARVMEQHGGERIVTLDSQSEGDGAHCAAIAGKLAEKLGLRILVSKKGWSPQDVPTAVEVQVHDLIFIDGLHAHPQVTHDFDAVLPFADDHTIFVWHDYWIPGVPEGVDAAKAKGVRCVYLPTSCEMVVGARDEAVHARLREVFPEGSDQPPVHGKLEPLKVIAQLTARYGVEKLSGRG